MWLCSDSQVSAEARLGVDPLDRVLAGRPVRPARGEVDPGLVRQQGMVQVEGGPVAPLYLPDPLVQARRPSGPLEPVQHPGPPGACPGADARRTDRAGGLDLVDLVAEPVHQLEDARLVAAHVRGGAAFGQAGVKDVGHGLEGRVVDRVGVREPGGDRGELGEVGEALGVDLAVRAEQVVDRELVEDHHHHRGPPGGDVGPRCLVVAAAGGDQGQRDDKAHGNGATNHSRECKRGRDGVVTSEPGCAASRRR